LICLCGFGTEQLFTKEFVNNYVFQLRNQQKENPQTFSDVVWLSLYAQHKFHIDLSFPSIKLSGMKFLPEIKSRGVAAITPNFGHSSKLFRLMEEFCAISFQPEMDHVIINYNFIATWSGT